MMKQLLGIKPNTKDKGLRAFSDAGCLLLDATYTPVNGLPDGRTRDKIIKDDVPLLVAELRKYAEPETQVILVKKNVCHLLVQRLKNLKEFQVLNNEKIIPYPGFGQQTKFGNMVRPMLGSGTVQRRKKPDAHALVDRRVPLSFRMPIIDPQLFDFFGTHGCLPIPAAMDAFGKNRVNIPEHSSPRADRAVGVNSCKGLGK